MSGLTMPSMSLQLCLADPFTEPDWTEIGPFCTEITGAGRGKQRETSNFEPGTSQITLWNQDGRFSAFNKTGPYYNLLSPGDANQEDGTVGTWTAVEGCTVDLSAPSILLDSAEVLEVTAT